MPERLPKYVSEAFSPDPPRVVGIAVSGGGDSMALLHLMKDYCHLHQIRLHAVTLDHGLRPEAREEARKVSEHCADLGVAHDTLVWDGWRGEGNLQDAAREARYRKIVSWARDRGITTVAVGHTADDQAETFLMRLARSSGVDGLSGMQDRTLRNGITWVRPLLRSRRATLRDYLRNNKISWIDDPSNDDIRFDRIKARRALAQLSELGINETVLAEVAAHLGEARRALDWQTFLVAKDITRFEAGAVVLDETRLRLEPDEIQRRLMIRALNWVSGSVYPPRRGALAHVFGQLREAQAATLDGCHIRRILSELWVFREYQQVQDLAGAVGRLWDNRWMLTPDVPAICKGDLQVRALGAGGLAQCPDWRSAGHPHVVLLSSPAVWRGDALVAAPLAGYAQNWTAELANDEDAFFAALLSH